MIQDKYSKFKAFVENLHQRAVSGQITWPEFNTRLEAAQTQAQQDMHIIAERRDDAVGEFWYAYAEDAPEIDSAGETEREAVLNVMNKVARLLQPDYEEIQATYPADWKPGE